MKPQLELIADLREREQSAVILRWLLAQMHILLDARSSQYRVQALLFFVNHSSVLIYMNISQPLID